MLGFEETVMEQLDNFKFSNEDLSKKQLMDGYLNIIKDLVREEMGIENEDNIAVIAKDFIKKYKKRTANLVEEISLPSNDIGIDFNMIREEVEKDDVLGYQLLLSTGIWGINDSKKLREVIGLSLEAANNTMCHTVCDWIDAQDGRRPSHGSKDPEEVKLGRWINKQKSAKQGKGSSIFYLSTLTIAKNRGYLDLFDILDWEAESNAMCHTVCDWMDAHDRRKPLAKSKDPEEKRMGTWIGKQKSARQGKGSGAFYSSTLAIAKKHGYGDLFDTLEAQNNSICLQVCDWMDAHDRRKPLAKSKDPEEKRMGTWIGTQKKARKGKGRGKFYLSTLDTAKKRGYPDLFELEDKEAANNEMCNQVCDWMDAHDGRKPSSKAKDPEEEKMGSWIVNQKKARQGKGRGIFYDSTLAIAKKRGYKDLFDTRN
jgi:hypothetical protein